MIDTESSLGFPDVPQAKENAKHAVDFSFELGGGEIIQALGVDKNLKPTPSSDMPEDVIVFLWPNKNMQGPERRISMNEQLDGESEDRKSSTFYKKMMSVLGRQQKYWLYKYELDDVVWAMTDPEGLIPDASDPEYSFKKEEEWFGDLLMAVDIHIENTYDDEHHRQHGRRFHEEWRHDGGGNPN